MNQTNTNINSDVVEFQAIDWYDYNTTDSKERMVSNNYQAIAKNQEVVVPPSPDDDDDDDADGENGDIYINKYKFQIFGRNRQGESVIVTVNDYTPFYFIQIPDKWGSTHLKLLLNGLKSKLPKELAETLMVDKCKIVKRKVFNGFTNGEEFKFVRLVFMNSSAIKYSRKIFSREQVRFEGLQPHTYQVYESSLDPILQFMQIRDVKPCGWIRAVNCRPNPLQTCAADINVVCSFNNIGSIQENMIAGFVRESYDIECICQCDDEGFPNFRRRKDEIIQIGSTFRRYPDKNSYIKYIVTQKKCAPVDDPLIKVIEAENEKDLLLKYRDIVNYENPDIRYGYNSHGFDDVYIYERAKLLKIDKEFLRMGRNRFFGSWFQEKKLSSSGLGQNILKFIESNGRVSIDIMKVIQRDHNLPNYKLDFVAEHFLEQNKNDLDHLKLFANYIEGKPEQIREIAEYCVQDCELLHNLVDFLNILPNNMAMSNVSIVPLTYIFMRGQGIKIFSLVSDQCRKHGILIREIDNEGASEAFEGAYVYEPREAAIFYEPVGVMDFNSLYPSIMIAHNLSQDSIVLDPKYDNLPGVKYNTYQYRNPETGVVKSAKFVDHLANPEFTGILSVILRYLLDERAATREQIKVIGNAIKKIKEGANTEKVIEVLMSNERVPNTIRINEVRELLDNKKVDEVIAIMESKIKILDSFQLAFKITANSIYGQCGSPFSKIRCKAISACVTAQGKNYLKLSEEHVREKYGAETIYGDTDSIFVKFNVDSVVDPSLPDEENQYRKREECRRLGVQAAAEITAKIGINPMKLGFEKVCHPLMLLRKKRYMYQKYEFDMRKATFTAMGVLLKRRDNCAIVQTIYRDIVDILIAHGTMKDVVKYLLKQFMKFKEYNKQRSRLRKEKYAEHLKLFTTSKTLKSRESYKFPERIEHRVLADRMTKRDPGNPPKPNDRIQFVYIKVPDKYDTNGKKVKTLQGDKIETPEYILEHNLEIDYKFYLTNKLKEPIMEILEMDYSKEKVKEIFSKLIERYDTA